MRLARTRHALGRGLRSLRRRPTLLPHTARARLISFVLSVLVLAGAATQVALTWATALPDNAVLRASDTVITKDEFQKRIETLEALYGVKRPDKQAEQDQFNKDAAKSVAVSHILDRAAQRQDIVIADKKARDTLNQMLEQQQSGGRDAFTKFLENQGIAEAEVLNELKRQLATSQLFEQVTAEVEPVTDEEVRKTYQDRKSEMVSPEQRHLRNIVVDSKQKAQEILSQAQSGADFATLAAQHSLDRSTKDEGGDLGTVTAEQLQEKFAEAAFQADKDSYFGPVKTQHGWNVGQVVEVTPSEQLSFDEVKEQLEKDLDTKRKLKKWRNWLGEQIKKADVEYADEYRPDDPNAPPSEVPRQ
ncbi:peptidyl-prolyl cis-trans isomerase C [Haloechinothrix alba]|uniref:Peptidyl-prolyl cis-trans isomerase C n=1 Tax=Haloechinothrix alba TaxID=664784 RepID=A0A239AUA3_9PSEU|nr:peptidyl-prolyl cis-trans isomerase [Haloechinothrix alba]SNR98553.1 peptidyl-prolyl cis-trans isomerase C [Haloechinothrix alba]